MKLVRFDKNVLFLLHNDKIFSSNSSLVVIFLISKKIHKVIYYLYNYYLYYLNINYCYYYIVFVYYHLYYCYLDYMNFDFYLYY